MARQKKSDPREPTQYVVLRRLDNDSGWEVFETVGAMNKDAAIKKATAEGDHRKAGSYKAVAKSSWDGGEVIENEEKVVSNVTPLVDDAATAAPPLKAVND